MSPADISKGVGEVESRPAGTASSLSAWPTPVHLFEHPPEPHRVPGDLLRLTRPGGLVLIHSEHPKKDLFE